MSWGISKSGRASAVATALEEAAKKNPCSEPEETIRQEALATAVKALRSMPPNTPVVFEGSGSQSTLSDGTSTNQLVVSLKPIWGFLE